MPRPNFGELRNELLGAGISPSHVYRTVTEIDEHFDDLVDAGIEKGSNRRDAENFAIAALGDVKNISEAMSEQTELKSWAWHHPRLALIVYPLACIAALPAVPLVAGVQHAALIARWAFCLLLSGFLTAFLFLVLQLTISPI